jgi:hypothetical protein
MPADGEVLDGPRVVARHEPAAGKHAEILVLDHYLEILARKPGALPGAILNGHEYVAWQALAAGIGVCQGGQLLYWNRGSAAPGPGRRCLAAPSGYRAPGPGLRRWIYSACLCFGLDLDEQARSGFRYGYSVYQAE